MTFDDFQATVTERVPGAPWRFRDYGDWFVALADNDNWSIELSYATRSAKWNWWNGIHHIQGATLPGAIKSVIDMARYQTDPLQAIGLLPPSQEVAP